MNDAEYSVPPHQTAHRVASAIVLSFSLWYIFTYSISGPSIRFAAIQVVATGFIWFCNEYYQDIILKRPVAYRSVAWIILAGIQPAAWLFTKFLHLLAS